MTDNTTTAWLRLLAALNEEGNRDFAQEQAEAARRRSQEMA